MIYVILVIGLVAGWLATARGCVSPKKSGHPQYGALLKSRAPAPKRDDAPGTAIVQI